jgi:colicin import membrane protein
VTKEKLDNAIQCTRDGVLRNMQLASELAEAKAAIAQMEERMKDMVEKHQVVTVANKAREKELKDEVATERVNAVKLTDRVAELENDKKKLGAKAVREREVAQTKKHKEEVASVRKRAVEREAYQKEQIKKLKDEIATERVDLVEAREQIEQLEQDKRGLGAKKNREAETRAKKAVEEGKKSQQEKAMVVQQAQAQDAIHTTERKKLQDIAMRHCQTGQQLALELKVAEKRQEKTVVQAQKAVAQAEEAEAEVQQTKKEAAAQKRENKLTKRKLKSAGKKDHVLWWCRGEIFN